jgi:hypothetical protein
MPADAAFDVDDAILGPVFEVKRPRKLEERRLLGAGEESKVL